MLYVKWSTQPTVAEPPQFSYVGQDPRPADDGKRHRCHKPEKHTDNVHASQCSVEWKQF